MSGLRFAKVNDHSLSDDGKYALRQKFGWDGFGSFFYESDVLQVTLERAAHFVKMQEMRSFEKKASSPLVGSGGIATKPSGGTGMRAKRCYDLYFAYCRKEEWHRIQTVMDVTGLDEQGLDIAVSDQKITMLKEEGRPWKVPAWSLRDYLDNNDACNCDINDLDKNLIVSRNVVIRCSGKNYYEIEKAMRDGTLPMPYKKSKSCVKHFWRVCDLQTSSFFKEGCAPLFSQGNSQKSLTTTDGNDEFAQQKNLYATIRRLGGCIAFSANDKLKAYKVHPEQMDQIKPKIMSKVLQSNELVVLTNEYFELLLEMSKGPQELPF